MKNKNIFSRLFLFAIVSLLAVILLSCDTDVTPTVYQDLPNGDPPVITSLMPPDTALAGVSEITINGYNFTSDPTKIFVYFNEIAAELLEVSPTKLVVKAPNFVKDSVNIKIICTRGSFIQ